MRAERSGLLDRRPFPPGTGFLVRGLPYSRGCPCAWPRRLDLGREAQRSSERVGGVLLRAWCRSWFQDPSGVKQVRRERGCRLESCPQGRGKQAALDIPGGNCVHPGI